MKRTTQLLDLALAVGEGVETDADFFEQREVEIGQRRGFGIFDVTAALDPAGAAAGDDNRQIDVVVHVRIAHAAAVQNQRVIQQRPLAIRRRVETLQELAEQLHVVGVDPGVGRDPVGVVGVVRQHVVRQHRVDA